MNPTCGDMIELTTPDGPWFVRREHIVSIRAHDDEEWPSEVATGDGKCQIVEEPPGVITNEINVDTAVLHR